MAKQEYLSSKIEEWVGEGLISPEQAEALRRREAAGVVISPARRVKADEIFVLPPLNHFNENLLFLVIGLAAGGLWLALSKWLGARERKGLVGVSRIFGALTVRGFAFVLATDEYPAT